MADFVFNQAKGRVAEFAARILANDPTNSAFVAVLLVSVPCAAAEDRILLLATRGQSLRFGLVDALRIQP